MVRGVKNRGSGGGVLTGHLQGGFGGPSAVTLFPHTALVLETLTRAGLLDSMTPEQLFVSVQDAAAHALERLVRGRSIKSGSQEVVGLGTE